MDCICVAQTGQCDCYNACVCKNCTNWRVERRNDRMAELIDSRSVRSNYSGTKDIVFEVHKDITYKWLNELAEFFGSNEIDVDHTQGGGGCSTCGWGGGCSHEIIVRNVKNWEGVRIA